VRQGDTGPTGTPRRKVTVMDGGRRQGGQVQGGQVQGGRVPAGRAPAGRAPTGGAGAGRRVVGLLVPVLAAMTVAATGVVAGGPAGVAEAGGTRGPAAGRTTTPVGWRPVALPAPTEGASHQLQGISCPSSTFCMAVGSSNPRTGTDAVPVDETFDGRSWTVRHPPTVGASTALTGVSCRSADDCTVVGAGVHGPTDSYPVAEHWNGSSWQVQTITGPTDAQLAAVACPSASVCVAVGSAGSEGEPRPLTERWTAGSGWTVVPAPSLRGTATLDAVSCPTTTRCLAVGSDGTEPRTVDVVEFYDGHAWGVSRTPEVSASSLNGISCPTTYSCVAVGEQPSTNPNVPENPLSLVLRSGQWATQAVPADVPGALPEQMGAVSCLSLHSCSSTGDYLTDKKGTGYAYPLALYHWNGNAWSDVAVTQTSGNRSVLSGVDCPPVGACTAVGATIAADARYALFAERGPAR
jgi:hypothetical protein